MSIINQAISDLQFIMENSEDFGTPVTFSKKDGSNTVTVNALTNKIMVDVDGVGTQGVSERTTVAVHEYTLTLAGYEVRNARQEVAMANDLVTITEIGGVKKYIVKYQIPDQKFGCLVFVLEKYAS